MAAKVKIPNHIFKGYDIRGIYPGELNEVNIVPIAAAIYTFLHKDKPQDQQLTLVVGTDMRISSPALTSAAIKTLVNLGANVVDIGMVSTPTFYFTVYHYGFEAGIQITASHNPKEWNGIKIVKKGQKGLIKIGRSTGLQEIRAMAQAGKSIESTGQGSVVKKTGILEDEVANTQKITAYPKIKKFKIAADCANAMGAQYLTALFKRVPANLIRMNFKLDGNFPAHQPDPLQFAALADIRARVISEKADLGLAPDGDGDRLFFIDEKGQMIPAAMITALIAREILKERPGEQILFDIRSIFTPRKIVEEFGGKWAVTKVGHAFITEALNETGAIFAGESSGHYFFRDTGNAESQMPIILTVLKVLTRENKTLSQVIEEVRRSFESGEINFRVSNANEIMAAIKEKYQDAELSELDGVTVEYPGWRMNLRISNTEPLLRLNLEAYNKEVMEEKTAEVKSLIESTARL